jgi:hypothetical protein
MTELKQLRELLCRLKAQATSEKRELLAHRIDLALAEVDRQIVLRKTEDLRRLH